MNREKIFKNYNWLCSNNEFYVIMGDDLDAALSTVLYLHLNPKSKLIGVYNNYTDIYFNKEYVGNFYSLLESNKVIWLDLDIYSEQCKSLGHHIVRYNSGDILKGFHNSCNLNELLNRSVTNNFNQKYPLGTIHFLMCLYEQEIPQLENYVDALIWLADSSFINAQSHRFRNNVENWIKNIFPLNSLINMFDSQIDTIEFEKKMSKLQNEMVQKGFKKGRGQVKSIHLNLTGFQCQPQKIPEDIKNLLNFVIEKTKWNINDEQIKLKNLVQEKGLRTGMGINNLLQQYKNLDNFLIEKNIFSYVFPFKYNINYTVFN